MDQAIRWMDDLKGRMDEAICWMGDLKGRMDEAIRWMDNLKGRMDGVIRWMDAPDLWSEMSLTRVVGNATPRVAFSYPLVERNSLK